MRFLPLLVILVVLALPGAASAATATARVKGQFDDNAFVRFVAARGEANRLTIRHVPGGLTFSDRANPVRAKGDCRQVDRHTARCPSTEETEVARLRDGDDRAVDREGGVDVQGGAGDDLLRGSRWSNELDGGRGDDRVLGGKAIDYLEGGPGRDVVRGGRGDDSLMDGERERRSARDVFDGGPGRNVIFYSKPVRVGLGGGSATGEDVLRRFEELVGGRGPDRLAGDGADNFINAGAGSDRLRGRGGSDGLRGGSADDRLRGGAGDDRLYGGAGSDSLAGGLGDDYLQSYEASNKKPDRVACGDGDDIVDSEPLDTLAADCELLFGRHGFDVGVVPSLDGDSADFRLFSSSASRDDPHGRLELSGEGGEDFGSADFDFSGSAEQVVSVPLTPAAQAALEQGTIVVVELVQAPIGRVTGYRLALQR